MKQTIMKIIYKLELEYKGNLTKNHERKSEIGVFKMAFMFLALHILDQFFLFDL